MTSSMLRAMTNDVSAPSTTLGSDLAALYEGWRAGGGEERKAALAAWIGRLHAAFYGRELARVFNRFQHVEQVLADVFARLSEGEETRSALYSFVAVVLVQLASDDSVASPSHCDAVKKKKKSKGKAQPTSPLAFLVANALKTLAKGADEDKHRELLHHQGETNEELRTFCVGGLRSGSTVDQKLLVELLELFHITDVDSSLVDSAVDSLLLSKSHSAVLKLCEIHPHAVSRLPEIAMAMAQAKDWVSAELLVRTFDDSDTKGLARTLIEIAIAVRDFKRAHRLVSNFALQQEYPGIDVMYSRDGLTRLIENKRWQLAITFVGSDTTLQRILLTHMLGVGELSFATTLLERIPAGADKDELMKLVAESTEKAITTATSPRSAGHSDSAGNEYLKLDLHEDAVRFCDSEDAVREAIKLFFPADETTIAPPSQVIGLDVEWRPVSSRSASTSSPIASILQIASSSAVVIADLLKLHDSDLLFEDFIGRLFASPSHLKVGFNFESDLRVLHHTFPERAAFLKISSFLDLKDMNDASSGCSGGNSLSATTSTILGKPLNKKMQLSDWEHRPLSSQQIEYAALDAYCLVKITEKISTATGANQSHGCTSECTSELSLSTRLSEESVAQCVARRNEYQSTWTTRIAESHFASSVVSPQEVQRFWQQQVDKHQHSVARYEVQDPRFVGFSLVPYEALKTLQTSSEDQREVFRPVNSICLFAADQPRVVCIDARRKLDMGKLARAFRVGRRKVRLATAIECVEVFGFAPGTVAPFGHRPSASGSASVTDELSSAAGIPIYADSNLQNAGYLAAGSGSADTVIWIKSAAFFELINMAAVGDYAAAEPADDLIVASEQAEPTSDDCDGLGASIDTTKTAVEYKFLADSMVAQVGRWLRTTGVDVVIWNDASSSNTHDPKREMLAMAAKDDRIVLTRDTQLPSRRDAGACFVLSDDECYKQFREVKAQFGLLWKREDRASRCARCNSTSFAVVDIDFVRTQKSKNVRKALESVTKFWKCEDCGKIYWEGPKYTPTNASTDATSDDSSNCGVKYQPVARQRVHLVLRSNSSAGT